MSAAFAPGLLRLAREIQCYSGPWPSDYARLNVFTLEHAASALIRHDNPKPLPTLRQRALLVAKSKKRKLK